MKILLAEDSRSNEIMAQSLKYSGHKLDVVRDGQKLVEEFIRIQPDVVLLDVNLPKKDGVTAAREMRELCDVIGKWIPIIFLAEITDEVHVARGIEAGGDDYLMRPINVVLLNAKLEAMRRMAILQQELQRANHKLDVMAMKDNLTGLANQTYFDEIIEKEFKRNLRNNTPMALIMGNIDQFDTYHDNYGQEASDNCLKEVADVVQSVARRPGDLVTRYDDGMAIILPETHIFFAEEVAKSLQQTFKEKQMPHAFSSVADHVTMSFGVASLDPAQRHNPAEAIKDLISTAGKGLYQAKQLGANAIVSLESRFQESRARPANA